MYELIAVFDSAGFEMSEFIETMEVMTRIFVLEKNKFITTKLIYRLISINLVYIHLFTCTYYVIFCLIFWFPLFSILSNFF